MNIENNTVKRFRNVVDNKYLEIKGGELLEGNIKIRSLFLNPRLIVIGCLKLIIVSNNYFL